ncbi:MAG: hypothetical protein HY784_00835 [Chloroflexi bacterium]|nr:hypothetical protein [Chloroflexota bacterium]
MPTQTRPRRAKPKTVQSKSARPRCGLCGKTARLMKTECCGEWICDDEDQYRMFSFARNSCHRNHDRYTLCSFHYNEGHEGNWQECAECRESFETEMYVWYGTNEYNFVKLTNPPAYKPTKCSRCKKVIRLGEDGYSIKGGEYLCEECSRREFAQSSRARR